jgi:formate dehydrogenase alpha subunit
MDKVELNINGRDIAVEPGATILEAALANGIYIPNMCWDRRLTPYGGCRLCVVEVEGSPKLMAACSTPVQPGMVIQTETPKLLKARKTVLELLLIHHPLDCPICDKAGECELQDLAFKYGPAEARFEAKRKHEPESTAAPLVERNPNRCILCGKCVRICGDHQGVHAINLIGRGFVSKVSPAFEETLDCEFCGQCIDICPVGALGSKPYKYRSRVWFMEEKDTICPYCGSGCTLSLGVREGTIVRARGIDGKGISKGDLCGKGRFGFDFVHSEKRLKSPLIKKSGEFVEATWEEALFHVAEKLNEVKKNHGAEAVGAIGSQRCSVEDNYMLQKFMRSVVGTGNIDSFARFGYAYTQEAARRVFGLNTLPIKFDSPLEADVILVVESDITSTQPVFGLNILKAMRMHDAKLIVADPKATKLTRHSSEWLRIKPGTSVALLNGIMNVMVEEGIYDKERDSVPGFGALKEAIKEYTPEKVASITGVEAEQIRNAARMFAGAKNRLLTLTIGGSENTKGLNTALAAADLVALSGSGPEALQMPVEYANTIGLFEAGVRPDAGAGHKPAEPVGLDIKKMLYDEKSPIKALYVMGENPVISFPRSKAVEQVMGGLELLVVQDIVFSETAMLADVVLPASSWAEKEGTFVGSSGVPQKVVKCIPETGQSIPDRKIFRNLARAMQKDIGMGDIEELRAEIGRNIDMSFDTSGYKLEFVPAVHAAGEDTDEEYPLQMVTGVLMQHSGSLTTVSKSLGSVVSDAYLQINPADAGRFGITSEGYVSVRSRRGEAFLKAKVTDEVPEGMLFVPAHFPHARVNALTYPAVNGDSPVVAVRVEPAVNTIS